MSYEAPLRCQRCGIIIKQKLKAKVPKNCPPCRAAEQAEYTNNKGNKRRTSA